VHVLSPDYDAIALFLDDEVRFAAALDKVSAALWRHYLALGVRANNKFTRSLAQSAAGFGLRFADKSDALITATRGLPRDERVRALVRAGVLWKDGGDPRRGEHSHTLQWLAIAEGVKTSGEKRSLYRASIDLPAPAQSGSDAPTLWHWLVGGVSRSATFRSPDYLTAWLLDPTAQRDRTLFVAGYLCQRYENRRWLTPQGIVPSAPSVGPDRNVPRAPTGGDRDADPPDDQVAIREYHGVSGPLTFYFRKSAA